MTTPSEEEREALADILRRAFDAWKKCPDTELGERLADAAREAGFRRSVVSTPERAEEWTDEDHARYARILAVVEAERAVRQPRSKLAHLIRQFVRRTQLTANSEPGKGS